MAKYIKVQIYDVVRTPAGRPTYFEPTDESRLEMARHLGEIKTHMSENQSLGFEEVEMSEDEYEALGTGTGWWHIWPDTAENGGK